MASEIFGTAAIFWVLIPVGLTGGALLLKLQEMKNASPQEPEDL